MTPDTVADGAERRVGEVNERQGGGDVLEGRKDRTVRTRFGAERVGKWGEVGGKGGTTAGPRPSQATTISPMLQWIPSEDTFSFSSTVQSPLYYPFSFCFIYYFPFFSLLVKKKEYAQLRLSR